MSELEDGKLACRPCRLALGTRSPDSLPAAETGGTAQPGQADVGLRHPRVVLWAVALPAQQELDAATASEALTQHAVDLEYALPPRRVLCLITHFSAQ